MFGRGAVRPRLRRVDVAYDVAEFGRERAGCPT